MKKILKKIKKYKNIPKKQNYKNIKTWKYENIQIWKHLTKIEK